jgi:MFS family permease
MASFGAGGLAAGPVNSRLAARHGHVRVLLITAALYAAGVVAMASVGDDLLLLGVLGGFAGLMTPPLTPALRSTLPRLVRPEERLSVFALESTLQETVFIAGPLLAGLVAALAGPRAALVVAAAATLVGTVGYCAVTGGVVEAGPPLPGDQPAPAHHGAATGRLLSVPVIRLLCGGVGFLVILCIVAVAVIAQVSGPAAQGSAGVVLGLSSLGSMVGGVVFGATVTATSGLRARYLLMAAAVAVVAGLAALGSPGAAGSGAVLLAVAVFAYGLTIAPVATVLFGRLSDAAGDTRATEAFGWMGAAMGVGGVLGDASGGWLVTALPVWAGLLVAAMVALGTAVVVPDSAWLPTKVAERT